MITRRIRFTITINSYWPTKLYDYDIRFPEGGQLAFKEIEFITDNINPLSDANIALRKDMGDVPYHVWYWFWLDYKEFINEDRVGWNNKRY